ncbi:MAG: hypothetical protein JXQ83_05565 [Candidatus Glassbacteria bacterium]|nr:hypothetical protein [Candidatus Glassbacteria bacterium]
MILALLSPALVLSPQAGRAQWLHYANHNQVRAVELGADGTVLWYTTTGGLVRLDLERDLYQGFGRSEGLPCAGLTGLITLPGGSLLAGTTDLGLVLRTGSGRWLRAGTFDGLPDERVYCLAGSQTPDGENIQGVWVGTGRGARKMTVSGEVIQPLQGSMVILENYTVADIEELGGEVFFATSSGLWQMSSLTEFTRIGREEGLKSLNVEEVERGPDGKLYLNAEGTLQKLAGGVVENVAVPFGSARVADLRLLESPQGGLLAAAAGLQVYFLDAQGNWTSGPSLDNPPTVIGPLIDGMPVLGTDGGGIYRPAAGGTGAYRSLKTPGPLYNLVTAVAVDSRGTVWTASASNATPYEKVGISRFDGQTWTYFNETNSPEMVFNMVSAVDVSTDDRVYLGTYFGHAIGTGGVNILDDGGTAEPRDDLWERYVASETDLTTGVIRGDIAFDSDGGAWIPCQFSYNLPGGLNYFDPLERRFYSYDDQLSERDVRTVAVDRLGNLWVGYVSRGLAVLPGGRGSPYRVRQVGSFTSALRGETGVIDLAVDQVNRVWIATVSKVVLLNFQEDALDEQKYFYQEIKPPSYAGLAANSVALEGLEAAWFATNSGIFRLELATDRWSIFNRSNSRLAADEVSEIALDEAHGVLWAATSGGLSALSLAGGSVSGTSAARLVVRPNPWHPVSEGLLIVSGIPRYSVVSILTVSGEVVRRFARGETVNEMLFWDGTNQHGSPCASGVFLILAEPPGGESATAKVALIR